MAICQNPTVDYFSKLAHRPENTSLDSYPSTYNLTPPESCDEILPSPISPSCPPYNFPRTTDKSDQIFNFGSFDDWMGWDDSDPADHALSPNSEYFPDLKKEPESPTMSGFTRRESTSRNINPARIQEEQFEFGDNSLDNEALFQSPSSMFADPPQNLYSTPLAWSTPTAPITTRPYTRLTQAEEAQLRAIAMPSLANASNTRSSSNKFARSASSTSSPEPSSRLQKRRKRKNSIEEDDDEDMSDGETVRSGKPMKKTAHNMIEKRYRTNLNDKIALLRDSVPSLRVASKRKGNSAKDEDLQGLTPAHKLNKATVLSKATEYIAHLEKRNMTVEKENATLKSRIEAFEILIQNQQLQPQQIGNRTNGARQSSNYGHSFDRILS